MGAKNVVILHSQFGKTYGVGLMAGGFYGKQTTNENIEILLQDKAA